MNITREDLLKARGLRVPQGGGEATRVPVGESVTEEKRRPLDPAIIRAMVDSFPQPTKDPLRMPRVLAYDPSLNEAGFALIKGGVNPSIRTDMYRSERGKERGEKVLALARFAVKFADSGFAPDAVIVEGVWYLNSSKASAESIQGYSEAVGAIQGALSRYEVLRVDPDWMPQVLIGRPKGGSEKQDRHAVARGLLERAGIEWPEGLTQHEYDAVALATAYLVREGWL